MNFITLVVAATVMLVIGVAYYTAVGDQPARLGDARPRRRRPAGLD